jgi:pilus assembly protein CpaE
VLLADFDIDSGLIGFLMKSQSRYSLLDAVDNASRMDLSLWKALVSNGHPGIEVIMAPSTPGTHRNVPVENFRYLVPFVRGHYDWTIVDFGRGLSPMALNVIPEVDETFIVTTLEIPALHHCKHIVQALLDGGYGQHRIRVLLNRAPKRMEVSLEELDRMLGVPIYATVPDDYQALYDTYAEGGLLAPNTNLGKHFARVAARVAGVQQKEGKKGRFSFMA